MLAFHTLTIQAKSIYARAKYLLTKYIRYATRGHTAHSGWEIDMNALTQIDTALTQRGMLALDGQCTCDKCGKSELSRDDVSTLDPASSIWPQAEKFGATFCENCTELFWANHDAQGVRDAMGLGMADTHVAPTDPDSVCRKCWGDGVGKGSPDRISWGGEAQFAPRVCVSCDGTGVRR
mgnify:CR=1 FL=1